MRDKKLDRLFDRFRRRGDVEALGEVFDATAPELLRVAASLVRDPNEADDLLQATFLTAIERCGRYESERRLVPWLLGILVNHAREERRERTRPLEVARLAHASPVTPEAHALVDELGHELERALAELSSEDRSVLDDYLRADKSSAEIARERGLAPGAARMRIHRGLDRLRRALPAGLTLGGAAGAASAQGLGAVRAAVLRAGTTAGQGLGASTGNALAGGVGRLIGGLMGKKMVMGGVALALAAAVWFLVDGAGPSRATEGAEIARSEARKPSTEAGGSRAPSARAPSSALLVEPSAESKREPLAATNDADLSGLRGRVVESDGRPVAGVTVALLEVEEAQVFPVLRSTADAGGLEPLVAASASTGPDGVFELQGASARALHALGVDLGGSRATLRLLDANLAPGSTADLGDVVLAATGVLSGSIVDPAGRPVAGARVRVGPIPEPGLALGLQHAAAGGAISELPREGNPKVVVELPEWTSALEAMLPLATTTTDAAGGFTLTLAAASGLTALVDAPGFPRLTTPLFDLVEDGRHELGKLVLSAGQSVRGRVLDSEGRPVANAELRAGILGEQRMAYFGPVRRSDAEGRFEFGHLPDAPGVELIGRRDGLAPWASAHEENGEYVLALEAGRELAAQVLDASGAPVVAPQFFARPGGDLEQLGPLAPPLQPLPARPDEARSGGWRLGPLARGSYLVAARTAGTCQATAQVEIGDEEPSALTLRLVPVRRVELLVRAAATGEALARASVRVEEQSTRPLACARTDDSGRAVIEVPDDAAQSLWLYVDHPRFAPSVRPLDASASQVVELSAGARLVARLVDPELAGRRCMLRLWQKGDGRHEEFHLPRIVAVSSAEPLELERLALGEWSWSLFESVAGSDLLSLQTPERMPQSLASGEFTLAEGQTFELLVAGDREPASPSGPGAAVSGVVRVEGRLAGALDVNLCPIEENGGETLYVEGSDGRFRFDDVPPGFYTLIVSTQALGEDDEVRELVRERHLISGTEEVRLEFDLENLQANVRVLIAEGDPAEGAALRVIALGHDSDDIQDVVTDRDGHARFVLARPGRYAVVAVHPDEGLARGEFAVSAGGSNELTLTLARGVACAGTLQLAPDVTFDTSVGTLLVHAEESDLVQLKCQVELEQGRASFRFVGLPPGKYRALLWGVDDMLFARFELPERGSDALQLSFGKRAR